MEYVSQLRASYESFTKKGAEVVAIGMGWPAMAAHFRDEHEIPFPLLVDHSKETYRALKIKRGSLWEVMGPQVWVRGAKNLVQGHIAKRPQQDPLQMGGVVVAAAGGEILFVHRSDNSSDNAPIEDLLAALP